MAPEGSSHAKKAARRYKRQQQKERQRQDNAYPAEFRLARKQLDQHHSDHPSLSPTTQHSLVTASSVATEPKPLIAKWIMEQNALYNSERGSETEGRGSNSSMSNIADQDGRASSPVPSYTTSSSRRTKSSYERHRTGSPPVQDLSALPSRLHEGHSVSPFETVDSLEAQTMSDSVSKFSDSYSGEPEYSVPPPQSAPPVSAISYKDAFNVSNSLSSQQMSNSLTPYGPSQQLDKLSTDVMYHTPQSGASLSGISSILPRLLQGRGGKPYLGRVHLKELDGDEIDMEKQRIKLMFYKKKNEERALREEDEIVSSQAQDPPSPTSSRKVYPLSPPPPVSTAHQFDIPTSLEEDRSNGFTEFSDTEVHPPDPKQLLQELETLEHMTSEQRRHCKELNFAREKESLDLKRAEVEFQERDLMEPGVDGGVSVSVAHQEKWQKDQKKRLRQLERFRAAQQEKMQKMELEERHAASRLKAYEFRIYELRHQLEVLGSHPASSVASAAIVESHLQSYAHQSPHPSQRNFSRTNSGCSPGFTGETREDQMFRPIAEQDQTKPEREWPQQDHPRTNPAQFVSMESINSSSLAGGTEIPDFSREIVNTISESTNMTEPTQDDVLPGGGWGGRYVANSDDPYAGEFASKYTYSDDEFFMDDRRMYKPEIPIDARYPFSVGSEREVQRSAHRHDRESPRQLVNGHPGYHIQHGVNGNGGGAFVNRGDDEGEEFRPPHWGGPPQQGKKKLPPPPVSEKPQNHGGGRTDHHYSRSSRPRLHNRSQLYVPDNASTVSGVSTSSLHSSNQNGESFKTATAASDVVASHTYSPSTKFPSPTSTKYSSHQPADNSSPAPPHSPGIGPPTSPPYSPFREHPLPPSTVQHVYSVPTTSSAPVSPAGQLYDVPRKGNGKHMTSPAPAIYDQPRPTTSPQIPNHVPMPASPTSLPPHQPPSTSSPGPHDPHSPFHNRPNYTPSPHGQLYDVLKPQALQDVVRPPTLISSDRDLARQTASNMAAHPYQYHGLPTKPMAPRSYSRGRQDAMGFGGDRGVRGQIVRPPHPQRVQRKQTEL